MFSVWSIASLVLCYLAVLFLLAFWGDKRFRDGKQHPLIYSLALGVHCTSWAFFGTTTQSATYGWAFMPTYLGAILVFVLAFGVIQRIALLCRQHNVSSLADFIALQYQHSHWLTALVTLLCCIGVVPYIALQLDAIVNSIGLLTDGAGTGGVGLYVAGLMALFAILFGTRSLRLTDQHPGLMVTIAFESVVKLVALLIIGWFVTQSLFDGVFDLLGQAQNYDTTRQVLQGDSAWLVYISHMLLGVCAMFCLPRQFHMNFVENNGEQELRQARWIFPLYLTAMTLFTLPIALAGHLLLDNGTFSTDTYVLALPVVSDQPGLSLTGFIGGLSAATSMVIVATLAVGVMISNNLATPLWLMLTLRNPTHHRPRPATLLMIRRITIILVLGVGYLYHLHISQTAPLAETGTIAMALLSQTFPAIILGIYWSKSHARAAFVAISAGAACWFIWLLWPSIKSSYYFDPAPDDFALSQGFVLSLLVNTFCFVLLSLLWHRPKTQAAVPTTAQQQSQWVELPRLLTLAEHVLGTDYRQQLQQNLATSSPGGYASRSLLQKVESDLTGQVGNISARILLATITEKGDTDLPDLVELVEEASQSFQFNHEVLQSSVQHIEQGISVLDHDLHLLAWNDRYLQLFDYPAGMIKVGVPIEQLLRYNAQRGLLGDPEHSDREIHKRMAYMRQGSRYKYIRKQKDGKVIELAGSPLPGGGFVTTYADITEYIVIQQQLKEAKASLEQRVEQRTEELQLANEQLQQAKQQAESANDSKTRFLAAAGHDLMQPFNAAALFADMLAKKTRDTELEETSRSLVYSLNSAESLLSSLLDMTRLETGLLKPHISAFPARDILHPLYRAFSMIAKQKSLKLSFVDTGVWLQSDPALLRRVLQNLMSNAIRYTRKGSILLGVRRIGSNIRLCVLDTGSGIPSHRQQEIFREFHQLENATGQQGLGLGLTIVEGISQLLSHPVGLHSEPGKGTMFYVDVPRSKPTTEPGQLADSRTAESGPFTLRKTVLVIDNEPQILKAMQSLLQEWGAKVITASDFDQALALCPAPVDLMLVDYHLDRGETGINVVRQLQDVWQSTVPAIINSADRSEAMRAMVSDAELLYLPKPIKPAALKRIIRRLFTEENSQVAKRRT